MLDIVLLLVTIWLFHAIINYFVLKDLATDINEGFLKIMLRIRLLSN